MPAFEARRIGVGPLEGIERDRESAERVWSGLAVLNVVSLVGFLAIVAYRYSIQRPPLSEVFFDRSFTGSIPVYVALTVAFLGVVLSIVMLRASQSMRRTTLIASLGLLFIWLGLSSAGSLRDFLLQRPLFEGRPQLQAVVDTTFAIELIFATMFLVILWPQVRLTVAALRHPDAAILGQAGGAARGRAVRALLGWPGHVPTIGRRRLIPFVLFALASLVFALGFLIGFNNMTLMQGQNAVIVVAAREGRPVDIPFGPNAIYAFVPLNLLLSVVIILLCVGVSRLIERLARSRVRLSMTEALATDKRPPIVFLRPFRDDAVTLPRAASSPVTRLLDMGRGESKLEQITLDEGFQYGPVVALGRPGDPIPPYGAARDYFANSEWQTAVKRLCRDASAIVFCLDDSTGVLWEFDHIVGDDAVTKTLFLIHPSFAEREANAQMIATLRQRAAGVAHASGSTGTLFDEPGAEPVLGAFLGRKGAAVRCTAPHAAHRAYRVIVRAFLRDRMPDAGKTPEPASGSGIDRVS